MLKGIYTPIVTPFNANEEIDFHAIEHNLEKWGKTDLDGIVVLGSNGENVHLTSLEKLKLVEFTVKNFNPDKKVIAGTGCESTRETLELSNRVAELGADAALVLPPHYYKGGMKDDILYQHYTDIADKCAIPVMIYNMPANTGINLSAKLVSSLSHHPNIIGIKDTSGNIVQLAELNRDCEKNFIVFAGNAGYLLPALSVGAKGATLALANILPEDCCKLVSLFKQGNIEEAKELQLKMLEINFTVTGKYGVPALKVALDYLGYKGGYPRRPLRPLGDQEKAAVKDILINYGALQ